MRQAAVFVRCAVPTVASVPPGAVLAALAASAVAGVGFGMLSAVRAPTLGPVDARYE